MKIAGISGDEIIFPDERLFSLITGIFFDSMHRKGEVKKTGRILNRTVVK